MKLVRFRAVLPKPAATARKVGRLSSGSGSQRLPLKLFEESLVVECVRYPNPGGLISIVRLRKDVTLLPTVESVGRH